MLLLYGHNKCHRKNNNIFGRHVVKIRSIL